MYSSVQHRTEPYNCVHIEKIKIMKNKKVVAVSFTDARNIGDVYRIENDGTIHVSSSNWTDIDMEVPGELEITSKIEDKVVIYTAKLTFREKCRHDYPPMTAFRVRLADGSGMLIGSSQRPYPVVTETQNISSGNSNSQLRELTVTYSNREGIPRVIL